MSYQSLVGSKTPKKYKSCDISHKMEGRNS